MVTMVSMHGMAGRFYVLERAIEAFSLTTKVYRDYIDTISKAHPDVRRCLCVPMLSASGMAHEDELACCGTVNPCRVRRLWLPRRKRTLWNGG
jgi:hypothetical protein